jgi:NTP pyrophosphatase (non-canonical NTP hydrolase)
MSPHARLHSWMEEEVVEIAVEVVEATAHVDHEDSTHETGDSQGD